MNNIPFPILHSLAVADERWYSSSALETEKIKLKKRKARKNTTEKLKITMYVIVFFLCRLGCTQKRMIRLSVISAENAGTTYSPCTRIECTKWIHNLNARSLNLLASGYRSVRRGCCILSIILCKRAPSLIVLPSSPSPWNKCSIY